jgi:hypothetical protein
MANDLLRPSSKVPAQPALNYRHFLSCFQEATSSLNRLRAREVPGADPANEVCASVKVLERRATRMLTAHNLSKI